MQPYVEIGPSHIAKLRQGPQAGRVVVRLNCYLLGVKIIMGWLVGGPLGMPMKEFLT